LQTSSVRLTGFATNYGYWSMTTETRSLFGNIAFVLRISRMKSKTWKSRLMPKDPRGAKQPTDPVAVMVGKIATGKIEDDRRDLSSAAAELGRKGGKKRAENLTPERRKEIARKAAEKRWKKG
jgi:hypothetical protein